MPSPETILTGLHLIANRAQTVAAIWHIAVFMALLGLVSGWRPSRRLLAVALVLPLLSVAVVAWIHRSWFSGAVFTALAIALGVFGVRVPPGRPAAASGWVLVLGIALTLFGFAYPHFLDGGSFWYLYAAPMGLLPCPTLAFVIGVTLIIDGVGSRAWAWLLALAGLFYGIFGVARLGVWLDVGLIIGAAALAVRGFTVRREA